MNRVIINFKVKKEQSFFGIEEVILDGQSFDPLSITASDLKTSKSLNLKGDGQNVAIQTTDILSFHCLAD
ncbi:hypothetical protein EGCR1_09060 [Enterococcus gilvus]|jgi:hypothetical protein|uniref:hypothetical protein n=1 Tax=Enterococcus gilvus TaxID=160453 RepID=UPI000DF63419|nr:hypothetical protein [Enterococcus gilvus]AXG38849.1 hypothetical protein EGCR1_09060 [Enterococcus gilvus]